MKKKVYRVRRFKHFPTRSADDTIEKTFATLKEAQLYAIKLNESDDSELYDTRWYVDQAE